MSIPVSDTQARAPSRSPKFWRKHFAKIKLVSGATSDKLLEDVANFLKQMAVPPARRRTNVRRKSAIAISKGTYHRIQSQFMDKWHCDQQWVNTTKELTAQFGIGPTKSDLIALLKEADPQ